MSKPEKYFHGFGDVWLRWQRHCQQTREEQAQPAKPTKADEDNA